MAHVDREFASMLTSNVFIFNNYFVNTKMTTTTRELFPLKKVRVKQQLEPNEIHVWTDGACTNNGKPSAVAGYGVYFGENDERNISARLEGKQTNQRAELMAVIKAIESIMISNIFNASLLKLHIYTDSRYVIGGATSWIANWKSKGWTNKKKPIVNLDLWKRIDHLMTTNKERLSFQWIHVDAHSGIHGNEMADKLAKKGTLLLHD